MREVNLLDTYPRSKRPIGQRVQVKARSPEARAQAKQFGKTYFDGMREQGYGGYYYDGRWQSVADRIIGFYGLRPGDRVLDIGCAKGFLLHDLCHCLPGLAVAGVDISRYAVDNAIGPVKPYLAVGNATHLPFQDNSFDLVIAINVVHNLTDSLCRQALREMERVSRRYKYLQVDSFRNDQEREDLERWQLTAELIYSPEQWRRMFAEAGYTGDYYWTITE